MHYIVFEGTSEDRRHAPGAEGLDMRGTRGLEGLAPGDVVWVVTRSDTGEDAKRGAAKDRQMPALCARLAVSRVVGHEPGESGFEPEQKDRTHRVQMDRQTSQRCVPFACAMVLSWDVWRRPFEGLSTLTAEQGEALETAWAQASGGRGQGR